MPGLCLDAGGILKIKCSCYFEVGKLGDVEILYTAGTFDNVLYLERLRVLYSGFVDLGIEFNLPVYAL